MEPLAGVLTRVLQRFGIERELLGWRAVSEWDQVVGARVARHSRAVAFRGGTLQVEVEGSAWMQELGFLKRDLVRTINRHLGAALIHDIRFIVPRGGTLR